MRCPTFNNCKEPPHHASSEKKNRSNRRKRRKQPSQSGCPPYHQIQEGITYPQKFPTASNEVYALERWNDAKSMVSNKWNDAKSMVSNDMKQNLSKLTESVGEKMQKAGLKKSEYAKELEFQERIIMGKREVEYWKEKRQWESDQKKKEYYSEAVNAVDEEAKIRVVELLTNSAPKKAPNRTTTTLHETKVDRPRGSYSIKEHEMHDERKRPKPRNLTLRRGGGNDAPTR